MPFLVPVELDDKFEIRLRGQLHGQTTITTFRYFVNDVPAGDQMDLETVSTQFKSAILEPLLVLTASEMNYVTVEVQKIAPVRLISYVDAITGTTGEVAGGSLPSGVAWVFRRKLLAAGRFAQGRIYIPGVPVSSEEDSRIKTAIFTGEAVSDLKDGMLADLVLGDGSLRPALIVPGPDNTWENRGNLFDIVPDQILRYQRRREVGVGQ